MKMILSANILALSIYNEVFVFIPFDNLIIILSYLEVNNIQLKFLIKMYKIKKNSLICTNY